MLRSIGLSKPMLTLFRSDTICSTKEIKIQMAQHIRQLPLKVSPIGDNPKIMRLELVCEPVSILTWLHNQASDTKIYWSDRDNQWEVGGIGVADCLKGERAVDHKDLFETMEDRLSENNPQLRFYGGISFNHLSNGDEWQPFGSYQFIVPQFELICCAGQTTFAFNIVINDIHEENINAALKTLNNIQFDSTTIYRPVPRIINRRDFPDKDAWSVIFAKAKLENTKRNFEKIVLARKSVFDFDVTLRPDALLKHLKDRTPHCFHFCFQVSPGCAFLGASPERLFETQRGGSNPFTVIHTEAIAGTRPRGVTQEQDKALTEDLLNSPKDALEHQFVVDAIRNILDPVCTSLKWDNAVSVKKLKGSQHLITAIEGELIKAVSDHQVLGSLHPTPAVAGSPTQAALIAIEQLEPFHRGWYAGPIGYVGFNHSEFAVAIRCGLIHQNELSLYAGAGIVKDSVCEDEWNEIENKISNFMQVFEANH